MDETLFVSHFVDRLREEIRGPVLSHLPESVDHAVLLAQIQESILDKVKHCSVKLSSGSQGASSSVKLESKADGSTGDLWKERQLCEYCRANNLCFYCGDKFEAGHAAQFAKHPYAQLHQLSAQELTLPLFDEVLQQLEKEDALIDEMG